MKFIDIFKNEFGNDFEECQHLFIPFLKKWQLKIYFTMIKQNIIREIEKEHLNEEVKIEKYFEMLKLCFDKNVFIYEISDLFLRLFFSLLLKLKLFVSQLESENMLKIYSKISEVYKSLKNESLEEIYSCIRGKHQIIEKSVDTHLNGAIQSVRGKIIENIVQQCSQVLKGLKGKLFQLTLMKSVEIPSKYLVLIPLILEPIQKNLEGIDGINDWKIDIIEKVTQNYIEMVKEVLQNAAKTGESLQRLRRTASSLKSETQIITLQMQIDSIEYQNQIESFGISIDEIPGFSQLKNLQ
jgi:hypothetical protein